MSLPSPEAREIFAHMAWADALVWRRVLALPGAREDRRTGELLYHLHAVQQAYLAIWHGEEPHLREPASFAGPEELCAWAREGHARLATFAGTLTPESLAGPVRLPWAAARDSRLAGAPPATLAETVLQVALHTAGHRGQVIARLRERGGEPLLVDFIAWIWTHRPAPEWPAPAPA